MLHAAVQKHTNVQEETHERRDYVTVQGLCTEPSGVCLALSTFKVSGLKDIKHHRVHNQRRDGPDHTLHDSLLLDAMLTFGMTSAAVESSFHTLYLVAHQALGNNAQPPQS